MKKSEWATKMINAGYRDDVCPEAFGKLADWCERAQDREHSKGLLLRGPVGTGKTLFLTTCLGKCRMLTGRRIVAMYNERGPTPEWHQAIHGYYVDTLVRTAPRSLIIDDAGTEPVAVHYGQKQDCLGDVLLDRYDYWQRHGVKTFITTNLPPLNFDRRYGRRVSDRVGEMCEVIEFHGASAR